MACYVGSLLKLQITYGGLFWQSSQHEVASDGVLHHFGPWKAQEFGELLGAKDNGEINNLRVAQKEARICGLLRRSSFNQRVQKGILRGHEATPTSRHRWAWTLNTIAWHLRSQSLLSFKLCQVYGVTAFTVTKAELEVSGNYDGSSAEKCLSVLCDGHHRF